MIHKKKFIDNIKGQKNIPDMLEHALEHVSSVGKFKGDLLNSYITSAKIAWTKRRLAESERNYQEKVIREKLMIESIMVFYL